MECGHPAQALLLFQELLPDLARVLGPDHPLTLDLRSNIALSTRQAGNEAEALQLYRELLPDYERVLGRDHPDTLSIKHTVTFSQRVSLDHLVLE
jgi:hypothetical protein